MAKAAAGSSTKTALVVNSKVTPTGRRLLGRLREAGAAKQAAALAERLPGAGLFELFRKQEGRQDQFRFGREADGSPAGRWGWEDLD